MHVTEVPPGPLGVPQPVLPAAVAQTGPNPIEVGFIGAAPQQRITVLVRIILAIPQLIVVWVLAIAAEFVAIIGWFGALFTGRLPDFAAQYLTGFLRWQTRVYAYLLLLTDAYPPFSLDDANYPVRLAARPGRLNRLAVFFRAILSIPALIVVVLLGWGLELLVLFVTWLIVLITGTMPESLHQALAAVVRFTARFYGYAFMLTSVYPAGLFGDPAGLGMTGTAAMPVPGAPLPAAGPGGPGGSPGPAPTAGSYESQPPPVPPGGGYQQPTYPAQPYPGQTYSGQPYPGQTDPAQAYPGAAGPGAAGPGAAGPGAAGPGAAGPGAADPGAADPGPTYAGPTYAGPGYPGPAYPGAADPGPGYPASTGGVPAVGPATLGDPPWPLVLSAAARKLIGLFLALGCVGIVCYVVLIALVVSNSSNTVSRAVALSEIQAANATLSQTLNSFQTKTEACATSPHQLQCVTGLDRQVAQAFDTFSTTIGSISMPSGSDSAAAARLAAAASQAGQVFQRLGSATSIASYQSIADSSNIQQKVDAVSQDYQQLGTALNTP
jgi:Domain of unknown function (DUF4389)